MKSAQRTMATAFKCFECFWPCRSVSKKRSHLSSSAHFSSWPGTNMPVAYLNHIHIRGDWLAVNPSVPLHFASCATRRPCLKQLFTEVFWPWHSMHSWKAKTCGFLLNAAFCRSLFPQAGCITDCFEPMLLFHGHLVNLVKSGDCQYVFWRSKSESLTGHGCCISMWWTPGTKVLAFSNLANLARECGTTMHNIHLRRGSELAQKNGWYLRHLHGCV